MRPYSHINVHDVYRASTGSEWKVVDKDDKERMIAVVLLAYPGWEPIWKRNTSNLFNERVLVGKAENL